MAQIVIKAVFDAASANAELAKFKQNINSIASQPVKISYEVNMDKVTAAQAKVITADAKIRAETEKTAQVQIAADAKVRAETEKTAQAQIAANAKIGAEAEKTAQVQAKAQAQVQAETEKTARAQIAANAKIGEEAEKTEKSFQQTGKAATKTGDSIGQLAGKVALWSAATTMIYAPIRAFEEALDTMKAVDDELVTIRKVTGAAGEELEAIADRAYQTASAYGVAADEYLSSVAQFTRAGYGDAAEGLGELAVKTQLVGDVTQDTANQFLLSVDAAYQYEGNIQKLSAVLDGANEIDNKYATSIQKIAEGLGTVAPIAAQAHVGVDELSAAIGTITAVTQRSGTEAARAFRALMLNIMGDTKTEIDEGVTWTTGEIAGLRDVIKEYATEAYEAAEATGEVINPMEAIAGLAKSMEEGVLTEQKLMEMVSDIGGKLRSSQLLALIQNWDMYQSMLADFGNAAGSADREVENALDSWTRKTEILKNKWVEFVQNFVNTDVIKGGLDVLTGVVDFLNTDVGTAIAQVMLLVGALKVLKWAADELGKTGIGSFLKDLYALKTGTAAVVESQLAMTIATDGLAAAFTTLTAAMLANPLFWVAAAGAIGFGIYKAVDAFTVSLEEQREATDEATQKLEEMTGAGSEYDTLISKSGELTAQEEARLQVLLAEIEAQKELVRLAMEEEFETYQSQQGGKAGTWGYDEEGNYVPLSHDVKTPKDILKDIHERWSKENADLWAGELNEAEYSKQLRTILAEYKDDVDELRRYLDAGMDFGDEQIEVESLVAAYDHLATAAAKGSPVMDSFSDATGKQIETLNKLEQELQKAGSAIDAYNEKLKQGEKGDTLKQYQEAYQGFLEDWGAGKWNSNRARSAIELFLPEEVLEATGYDMEKAGELLANSLMRPIFEGPAEEAPRRFTELLYELADGAKGLIDENGNLLVTFEEADGAITPYIQNLEKLAEYLDIQPESLAAILDYLSLYTDALDFSREDIDQYVRSVSGAFEELNGVITSVDLEKLVRGLAANGTDAETIYGIVDALRELDGIEIKNPDVDLSSIIDEAGKAQEGVAGVSTETEELDGEEATVKVNADTATAETNLDRVSNKMTNLDGKTSTVTIKQKIETDYSDHRASGTGNAPGGPTLVNEEGAELIKEGDTAFIAGGGRPTVVDLEPGATVYTAKETRAILDGESIDGAIPALDGGAGERSRAGDGFKAATIFPSKKKTSGKSTGRKKTGKKPAKKSSAVKTSVSVTVNTEDAREALDELLKDMEHEIFLWEKQGDMEEAILSQYRKMQKEVHDLAEKFRRQGLSETSDEIQELQKLWWKYEDEIEDVYQSIAKAQEALWDELEDAVKKQLEEAKNARDAEVDAIDRQIEALRDAAEEEDKLLTLEEKRNAVIEAQNALLDAQNERTVRIFNADTNQWEWVADARNVESAENALEDAKKDLEEYEKELALDAEIEALEERKAAINAAYDSFEAEWEKIQQSIEVPGRAISAILKDIAEKGAPAMKAAIENVTAMLAGLSNYGGAAVGQATGGSFVGGGGTPSSNYIRDTTDYSMLMLGASSYDEFKYWEGQRNQKIEAQGIDLGEAGYRDNEKLYQEWAGTHTYDSGGILRGLGGVKATEKDEAVLPPSLTAAMLAPTSDETFRSRVLQLGYLYGERDSSVLPRMGISMGGGTNVTHNGGPYYINGIEIGAREAENMSLSQLARQMKVLALHTAQ